MEFFSPQNVFKGQVSIEGAISADNHAVTKQYLEANAVVGIAADSANYAELVTVNGQKELKLKPLTITDVAVDTVATSIGAWVTANYTNGNEKQEGDIIILTAVAGRAQTWIHNGGAVGDATDFTEIEGADVTDSEIRASLSASAGIDFNAATGEFTADQAEIRGFFAAGTGLAYDNANGSFALDTDTDGISEGVNNLYFSQERSRESISVSGAGLSYDSGTGVIDLALITDDITEDANATNLWFTDQRARGAISVAGSGLQYSSATGVMELVADTSMITESGNLYYTDARSRGAVSVATVVGPDVQLLQYNSATGVFSVQLSDVFAEFVAGQGLSYSNGEYALDAVTDDIAEGLNANNLWFTDERARGAISADPAAGNMVQYNDATGEILVALGDFRSTFAPQSLTANTWATLNHGLGEKIVHVSAYDVNGNLIQLDVQLIDANNVKVKSVVNVTDAEIVVSL